LAYERLHQKAYRNLRVLDEGIPGWIEQGHPTEGWQAEGPFQPHPYEVPAATGPQRAETTRRE